MTDRSNKAETRNPLLSLPAFVRLANELEPAPRALLVAALVELRRDMATRAETSWRQRKAPMAAYWKAASVYCGHIARVIKRKQESPMA
jgi:hypothetical protein